MLVTLGSNVDIASGASQTFQYACNSAQRVYISCDDDGTDALKGFLTVQIGNDVICNDISFEALAKISLLRGGGASTTQDTHFCLDIGSHVLEPLENLYVTLRASVAMTAFDVSACVNEGGVYEPLKYTNYSDSVFTDSNTLEIFAWADASLRNDTTAFTIRNQAYSSTPQVQSGVNVSLSKVTGADAILAAKNIGYMGFNQVPMDTSVNYSSTTIDGVVCVSAMPKTSEKANASAQSGQAVISSMTSSERKAL